MSIRPMIITDLDNNVTYLLEYLNMDPNKFDINSNLVLSYYKKKHGKQYAFLTDQYCEICIYYCNKFESTTNDEYIFVYISKFAYHISYDHYL